MNQYSITLEDLVSWLRSKENSLRDLGIALEEVQERRDHIPAAAADFDSARAIGRINAWVSGEVDFEVLRREDGTDVLFRRSKVSRMDEPALERAYSDFLRFMLNPDEAVSIQH
jgi:hypothetical protein